jgi:DNA-binding LacI/PurR family transcriptional regulator
MKILKLLDALQTLTEAKIVDKDIADILGITRETFSRKKAKNEALKPSQVAKIEQAYKELGYNINLKSFSIENETKDPSFIKMIEKICERIIEEKITPKFIAEQLAKRKDI